MSEVERAKAVMAPAFAAMRGGFAGNLARVAPDALFRMCHPFGDLRGAKAFVSNEFAPLKSALKDLERQEFIRIAGFDADGALWVGSYGQYAGRWLASWLGIPATGRSAVMRFHEFYRIEGDTCVEVQAIWDIPEMMMQAGAWPMAPQLGRFLHAPAPMSQDGLSPHDASISEVSGRHVIDMLVGMTRHPSQGGPEVMELERFWHPSFR